MKRARRILCGVALLAPGSMAGCLLPYAYPKLEYVPGADFTPAEPDVRAFRVDVEADQIDLGENSSFELTPIALRPDGRLPGQLGVSLERGVYIAGVAVNYNVGRVHTTRVRLYRPGYQLVEIAPWGSSGPIVWAPAADWAAQEKAIDDLLRRPFVSSRAAAFAKNKGAFWGAGTKAEELPPLSSESGQAPPAFAFAASEYARVAKLAPTPEDAARLREKARLLAEHRPITEIISASTAGEAPTR
ncbi:MAG: hypothetical protein J0I06_13465 [Planctomycetes bacterium]|nr:hypothetical protein [Planctomycetota bacterium]